MGLLRMLPHVAGCVPFRRERRGARWTLAAVVVTVLAAWPVGASAGEYEVSYCQPGMDLQDWQRYLDTPGIVAEGCASGTGGVGAEMKPNGSVGNTRVVWLLRWPSGIRPVHLVTRFNRFLDSGTGAASGGATPYGWCSTAEAGGPCPSGQTTSVVVDRAVSESSGDPGQEFSIGVVCDGPSIAPCGGVSGWVDVSQLDITWRDVAPPSGSATIDALASSVQGVPVRGTHPVEYRAVDGDGSGVRRVEARIDGKAIATSPQQCAPPYRSMRACPGAAIGELAVDTAKVDDGTHQLEVVAIDVGGNDGTLASTTIVTQNGENVGPGSDPALRGTGNGTYGADDARLTAWWPATGKARSTSRKVQRRCKRSGHYRRTHAVACRGRAPGAKLHVGYSTRKANRIRGRLTTPTGKGVAGATLQLVATPAWAGATPTVVETLSTDGTGRFSVRVPVALGSASYSVQWRARSRDTLPASSAELQRTVRAATSLSIKPSPIVYRRQRLEITGTLRGRTGTRQGTAIVIQANAGSSWRAVTTVRARASGRWTARYRVPHQLRGRYRFRAVVKPAATYPYAAGSSGQKRVTVR